MSDDWARAGTAYGPGTAVPALVAQLHSDDARLRESAVEELWSALCHQETVYEASALAVPLLVDAAFRAPLSTEERHQVLALVAGIGRGEDTCWEGYTSWEVVQRCSTAVRAVFPALVERADGGDDAARPWAAVLATRFPEAFRALGHPVGPLLQADRPLRALVELLVGGIEPDVALVEAVAARDEETLEWLHEALSDQAPSRQARQVVWDLALKGLL